MIELSLAQILGLIAIGMLLGIMFVGIGVALTAGLISAAIEEMLKEKSGSTDEPRA